MNKIIDIGVSAICLIVGLLGLASGYRLFCIVPLLSLFWLSRKVVFKRWRSVVTLLNRHVVAFCIALAIVGVLWRVVVYLENPSLNDPTTWGSDYQVFFAQIQELLAGNWVNTKSWTTLFVYSFVYKLFGVQYWALFAFTTFVNIVTTVGLAYVIRRMTAVRLFCTIPFLIYFLNPLVVSHTFNLATEHLYSLFFVASLLSLVGMLQSSCLKKKIIATCCYMFSAWLATWSRGEGILLVLAIFPILIIHFARNKDCVRAVTIEILLCFALAVSGACVAAVVNYQMNDSVTIFCSNDNYWPRLFGSNRENGGAFCRDDMVLIRDRYFADHPDCDWEIKPNGMPECFTQRCPKEVVPYISEEMARRWRCMSIKQIILFVTKKWRVDLQWDSLAVMAGPRIVNYVWIILSSLIATVICLGLIITARKRLLLDAGRDFAVIVEDWLFAVMSGNLVLLAVAESAPRYGWSFLLCGCVIMANAAKDILSDSKFIDLKKTR